LVRAYTDAVAQALLKSDKVPLVHKILQSCRVPYALEGMVRRELTQSQGDLRSVAHDSEVTLTWEITDMAGAILTERLNETSMGKLVWLDPTDGRHG
jgi:putative IMPACT (imprinted ancient) family translation regulator